MAQLDAAAKNKILKVLVREWSRDHTSIPFPRPQVETVITFADEEAEASDTSLVTRVPAGDQRQFLIDNPTITRRLKELIERTRKETL